MRMAPPHARINVRRNHSLTHRNRILHNSLQFSMAIPSAPPHRDLLLPPFTTCLPHRRSPKAVAIMRLTLYSRFHRPALKVLGIRFRRNHCPRSTAPLRLRPLQHPIRWDHLPILMPVCMHLRLNTFVLTRTHHIFHPSNSSPRHTHIQAVLMTVSPPPLLCCLTIHPNRLSLLYPLQFQITSITTHLILLKGTATQQTTI